MENEFFRFDPTWQLHSLMTAEQRNFNFDSPLNSIVSSNNSSIVSNESFKVQEFVNYNGGDLNFIEFSGDPGFAERAAAFSCFNGRKTGYHEIEMRSVSDHQMLNPHEEYCLGAQDSDQCRELAVQAISARNKSPVFEKIAAGESGLSSSSNEMNPRKRRVNPKRKANESAAYPSAKHIKVGKGDVDTNTNQKKTTSKDHEHENCLIKSEKEQTKITDDPPKDYIHVRARRGEATDSHSLAERARREKIGERMKLLQDLVPGCDKVTGKAVMLDEIINYVQSLQRQVEFLSMKLASVNFRPKDVRIESHVSKDKILRSNNMFYETDNVQESKQCQNQNMQLQLASLDGVLQCFPQFESLSEGDLHRLAQMGLARF